jgi:ABC-type spermidine/putrescine transport system permease subunit I
MTMEPLYFSLLASIGTVTVVILLGYTIAWFIAHALFDNFY